MLYSVNLFARFSAIAVLGFAACAAPAATPSAARQEARATQVRTAPVTRGDVIATLSFTGDVRSEAAVAVVPRVAGRIAKVHLEFGASVRAGDPIVDLETDALNTVVRQADASLATARARLDQMRAGPRADVVAQAEANARAAKARADAASAGGRGALVAQAQAGLDVATLRLDALRNPRAEMIAIADANIAAAQARLDALVKGARPEQIEAARLGVAQATEAAAGAARQRDGICAFGPSSGCETARAAAVQAEGGVYAARAALAGLTAPPTDENLAQSRAALETARQQAALARSPAGTHDIAQAENAVVAAQAALEIARRPVAGADQVAIDAQAEGAKATADLTTNPFTPQDLTQAEAAVTAAEAALELARANLRDAIVRSPIAGVLADSPLPLGSMVSPATTIVQVISPRVEVVFAADEARLPALTIGQEATIDVVAYPARPFVGTIATIAPTVDTRTRTVQVRAIPTEDALGRLLPGMFAEVQIIIHRRSGVLRVPVSALLRTGGQQDAVLVAQGGQARRTPVRVGLRGVDSVEIVQGVDEGDAVIVDAPSLNDGEAIAVAAARS